VNRKQLVLVLAFLFSLPYAFSQTAPTSTARVRTYKREAMQFFMQGRQSPDSRPAAEHMERARAQQAVIPFFHPPVAAGAAPGIATTGSAWTAIGPVPETEQGYGNVAGRVTSIAADTFDDSTGNTIYVGTAFGGVWKSTNALSTSPTFTPLSDGWPSLSVGAIALDSSTSPATVIVGTGEGNFSGDSYYGVGVERSTDGGKTWTQITTAGSNSFLGLGFSKMMSLGSGVELAATVGTCCSAGITANPGVYRSADDGQTWALEIGGDATDLAYDASTGKAYVALAGTGVGVSANLGVTWTAAANPFLSGSSLSSNFLRGSLATRAGTVYLLMADFNGKLATPVPCASGQTTGCDTGLVQSTNGGASWTLIAPPADVFSEPSGSSYQGWYDTYVEAPTGQTTLVLGGIDIWGTLSVSGMSTSWNNLTNAYSGGIVHPDQHAIAMVSGSTAFIGNDGGIWSTTNEGVSFTDINTDIGAIQFYSVSPDPLTAGTYFGGAQDNGTSVTSGSTTWSEIIGGDGGNTDTATYSGQTEPSYFAEYVYVNLFRSDAAGNPSAFTTVVDGATISDYSEFIVPYEVVPSNPANVVLGTYRVWMGPAKPTSSGAGWNAISPDVTLGGGDVISALAVAPSSADVIYTGSAQGAVSFTTNATVTGTLPTWTTGVYSSSGRPIGGIAVNPTNPKIAILAIQGFGTAHVVETTNGGTSWTDITGNLPDAPANSVVIDPSAPGTIYVGTDVGVYVATDGGVAGEVWKQVGTSLPNVPVLKLKLTATSPKLLVAATHGRGAWTIAAVTAGSVTLSPTSLTFSSQADGTTSSAQSITVTNGTSSSVTFSSVGISGTNASDFKQTNTCGSAVSPSGTCSVSVTFTPSIVGAESATLTLTDSSSNTYTASLSGTGATGSLVTLTPSSLSFGNVNVGSSSSAMAVTLNNTGTAAVTITGISISGTDFTQTNTCGSSVAAAGSCTISVTFSPKSAGPISETLSVNDSASGSPQTVALSGTGVGVPAVTLSPTSVSFSNGVLTGSSAKSTVTLTNSGTGTLTITSIAFTGTNAASFAQTNTCGTSVAAGANCVITVVFGPTAVGAASASLNVADNASGSPQSVSASGIGADIAIGASSGSSTSATVSAGQTATYNLVLTPTAGYSNTLALTCSGAPSNSTCSVAPASLAVSGGTAGSAVVTVVTKAATTTTCASLPPLDWKPEGPGGSALRLLLMGLGMLALLALAGSRRWAARTGARWTPRYVLGGMLLAGALLAAGCGSNSSNSCTPTTVPGTPAGTSTVTLTATDSLGGTRTANLTLTVN
jgi:hypothetical protein